MGSDKVPDAPLNLERDNTLTDQTQVSFSWDAPEDDGGESVSDYQIQLSAGTDDYKDIEDSWSKTKYTYKDDINSGDTYTFRVRARNN